MPDFPSNENKLKINSLRTCALLLMAQAFLFIIPHHCAAAPSDAPGKQNYPLGPPMAESGARFRVGTFSNMDRLFPNNRIRKGTTTFPLPKTTHEPHIDYILSGSRLTLDDYLLRNSVSGLLIIKDGRILVEHYRYDRTETDRFVSNSMAKSITGLAIGLAHSEGRIRSLDDKAATYVPELATTAYGQTTIRNLLRMSSGIQFSEDYSGDDDLTTLVRTIVTDGSLAALRRYQNRVAAEGTRFSYASSETLVLGLVVRACTGTSLSDYVSEKIWQPMGAEADATWVVDPKGMEWAFAKFNAVLRDYGRLGWLLANDGILNGSKILPYDFLIEATDWHRQPEAFRPGKATADLGYGYQFWIFPGEKRRFALMGIFGQLIYVDPERKLVVVQTAAAAQPSSAGMRREFDAFVNGIINSVEAH